MHLLSADWISWIGVIVSAFGVLIAVPDAVKWSLRRFRRSLGELWQLLKSLGLRRPAVRVSAGAATGAGTAGMAKMALGGRGFSLDPHKPLTGEVVRLVGWLDNRISDVEREARDRDAELVGMVDALRDELRDESKHIRAALLERERAQVRVDARGVWPIVLGVILTGAPDDLAGTWLGGALVVIAVPLTAWMAIEVWRDYAPVTWSRPGPEPDPAPETGA
jgi:hypothetical protein